MLKRITALCLSALLLFGCSIGVCAEDAVQYRITNPYEGVTQYLGDDAHHYKTDLHCHCTISDANEDYADMIKAHYLAGYDIVGFADHGVLGRYWNEEPQHRVLFAYQYIVGKKVTKLTDEEYKAITNGTYQLTDAEYSTITAGAPLLTRDLRTENRGMQCVPQGIELNNITMTKCHVNGYFCDFDDNGGGRENGFEYAVKNVDKAGGISVINHPGDWMDSKYNRAAVHDFENIRLFGDILNQYKTCQGIEVLNNVDSVTRYDREFWDELLQYVIPRGERNVFGFGNTDAHEFDEIDSSFMDFILPEYSLENVKSTMQTGNFFAVGRRARTEQELWDAERNDSYRAPDGTPYPTVTSIVVDDENDVITVTAKNADKIDWIANGSIIASSTDKTPDGQITATLYLGEHSDEITCYVRFQAIGKGGICLSQAFICDDGDMARFVEEDDRTPFQITMSKILYALKSTRFYVLIQEAVRAIKKELS